MYRSHAITQVSDNYGSRKNGVLLCSTRTNLLTQYQYERCYRLCLLRTIGIGVLHIVNATFIFFSYYNTAWTSIHMCLFLRYLEKKDNVYEILVFHCANMHMVVS
jgi:hypothetical protein